MNTIKLGDITELKRGTGLSRVTADEDSEIEICRYIRLVDLKKPDIPKEDKFFFEADKAAIDKYTINEGDLAICDTIIPDGKPSVYIIEKKDSCPYIANQILRIFSVDKNIALPKYLYFYLNSNKGYEQLAGCIFEGNIIRHMKLSELKNIEIPMPTLEEQKKYVDECESINEKVKELNEQIAKQQNRLMTLFG